MKNSKNATFIQRLCALLLDMFLISMVTSVFTVYLVDNDNYQKLTDESNQIVEQYTAGEISPKTYISKASDISYDLSRQTAIVSIITIAINILYFVVFQFYKKGQTIGKKLMKIRLVNNEDKDLTMNQVAIRSLIINFILVDMVMVTFSVLGTKDMYFVVSMIVELIQYIVLFAIAIMVLSKEDRRGLHDVFAKTKVVKDV